MTSKSKRELLQAIRPRYLQANKTEKAIILDEFCAATGYHRKYAIRLLKHGPPAKKLKKLGRTKIYQGEVVTALIRSGKSVGGSAPDGYIPICLKSCGCWSNIRN